MPGIKGLIVGLCGNHEGLGFMPKTTGLPTHRVNLLPGAQKSAK